MDWTVIGSVATVCITGGVTILAAKVQHKGRPENALIDQLQEEMATLRKDVTGLQKREKKRDDYIVQLREHINAGNPPPPPPWPEGLYD